MYAQVSATSSDNERNELRALIEQRTKEFEARNGAVETQTLIKKDSDGSGWNGAPVQQKRTASGKTQTATNTAIIERYATTECTAALAKELGISESSLAKRAARFGVARDRAHPNVARANERMAKVEKLLDVGEPVKAIAEKLQWPERTVRYYRNRIAAINKAADAIEKTIDGIEARTK